MLQRRLFQKRSPAEINQRFWLNNIHPEEKREYNLLFYSVRSLSLFVCMHEEKSNQAVCLCFGLFFIPDYIKYIIVLPQVINIQTLFIGSVYKSDFQSNRSFIDSTKCLFGRSIRNKGSECQAKQDSKSVHRATAAATSRKKMRGARRGEKSTQKRSWIINYEFTREYRNKLLTN